MRYVRLIPAPKEEDAVPQAEEEVKLPAPTLYTAAAKVDVLGFAGRIEIWTAATAKKPASMIAAVSR